METEPPHITPARGPPLWDEFDAHDDEGVQPAPSWDDAAQAAPDFELELPYSGSSVGGCEDSNGTG